MGVATPLRCDSRPGVDIIGIYVENHHSRRRELGALILRMRGGTKHSPHLRTPEIHQKSSEIDDLENEPGHVWRLPRVSGVTGDDVWHHETS